jgi:hypothetical protein
MSHVSNASAKAWDDFFRDVNRLTVTAVVYWSGILAIAVGLIVFGRLLRHSGYNRRLVHPMWGFSINRAGLPLRALAAKGGASAHGTSFAIHIVLATLALLTGHPRGAVWILLPGVLLHLYPVLLQRAILLRLQPLLDQLAAKP